MVVEVRSDLCGIIFPNPTCSRQIQEQSTYTRVIQVLSVQFVKFVEQCAREPRPAVHCGEDIRVSAKGVDDAAEDREIIIQPQTSHQKLPSAL
jgi:hypothetical protein